MAPRRLRSHICGCFLANFPAFVKPKLLSLGAFKAATFFYGLYAFVAAIYVLRKQIGHMFHKKATFASQFFWGRARAFPRAPPVPTPLPVLINNLYVQQVQASCNDIIVMQGSTGNVKFSRGKSILSINFPLDIQSNNYCIVKQYF